jgi:hypothetical protein
MGMARVVAARALEPFEVWLRFDDGSEGVVDLAGVFAGGGVFEALRDPQEFRKVRVERGFGTIEWPGGVDLDPDVLYAQVTGKPLPGMAE